MTVFELIKNTKVIISQREAKWKEGNTIMLDIFMRRERHILTKPVKAHRKPKLRSFGPQTQEDLADLRQLETLEKILPVLNGLIYLKQENRDAILSKIDMVMTLFDIFSCQLPIELHENALYALLNLLSAASKQLKEFVITQNIKSPGILYLLRFAEDLYSLEYDVIKGSAKFIVTDYGIKVNPLLEEAQYKAEKTLEEMQATVIDVKYYEYLNEAEQMLFFPNEVGVPVEGKEFEGLGLHRDQVVTHVRELRALVYQIVNVLVIGNAKTSLILVTQLSQQLP